MINGPPQKAPGHHHHGPSAYSARSLLPLKDGRKLFAAECGIGGGFVPCDVRDRMLSFIFGEVLARPVARPRQSSAVFELLDRFFPGERLAIFDERIVPEL